MTRYHTQNDPLCYPDTQILRNRANLRNQDDLDQFEQLMFLTRADEPLPAGALDHKYFQAIHRHFFQDVYDWAGSFRTIRTGKGGNWFCYPEFIEAEMQRIFSELAAENYLTATSSPQVFATRAAHYIGEINAVHPFREGNGRCQLAFLTVLLNRSDFEMDEKRLDPSPFMAAMIASFRGNIEPLANAILAMIYPTT